MYFCLMNNYHYCAVSAPRTLARSNLATIHADYHAVGANLTALIHIDKLYSYRHNYNVACIH